MSEKAQSKILDGVVYGILALALFAVGVLGVVYIMDPANVDRPFLILDPATKDVITKHQAAMLMMPIGFLGGASLLGVVVWKLRGGGAPAAAEQQAIEAPEDAAEEA